MTNLINLSDHRSHQLKTGIARCLVCGHEWDATQKVLEFAEMPDTLECPKCGSFRGFFKYPSAPKEGSQVWVCNCGCDLFYITEDGMMCRNCGRKAVF